MLVCLAGIVCLAAAQGRTRPLSSVRHVPQWGADASPSALPPPGRYVDGTLKTDPGVACRKGVKIRLPLTRYGLDSRREWIARQSCQRPPRRAIPGRRSPLARQLAEKRRRRGKESRTPAGLYPRYRAGQDPLPQGATEVEAPLYPRSRVGPHPPEPPPTASNTTPPTHRGAQLRA